MSEAEYLAGRLLLAMPGMADPNFDHAVIAMCVHDENGALGIGIGHVRAGIRLHALMREVGLDPGRAPDCEIHHGGPVEPGRGFILHSRDWHEEETVEVGELWALSASIGTLRAIAEGKGPERWLVALGYAGWAPGQLEEEMRRHGWFPANGREEILFDAQADGRWTAAWRADGIDPALLVGETGRA